MTSDLSIDHFKGVFTVLQFTYWQNYHKLYTKVANLAICSSPIERKPLTEKALGLLYRSIMGSDYILWTQDDRFWGRMKYVCTTFVPNVLFDEYLPYL